MHPRAMLERASDEADLEQLDGLQHAASRGVAGGGGAVAEAQATHRTGSQERSGMAVGVVYSRDYPKAARILRSCLNHANRLVGPVLPKQRQRVTAAGEGPGKCARHDSIPRRVRRAEQRGVSRE